MGTSYNPKIVTDGLILHLDAANVKSYPASQDPYVNSVSLLLDGESLIDKSANARTFTAAVGASISTANKKYGNSSIYCTGSNSYIYNSSFNSSFSGDFTIEFWVYFNSLSSINNLIFIGNESSGRHGIFINSIGKLAIDLYFTGTIVTFNSTITTGSWVHLAFVRTGTTVKLFVNGVQDSTTGTISGTYGNANGVYIGSDSNAVYSTNAYFDDIRITSGICRYSSNFTPPTAPLSLPGIVTDITKNKNNFTFSGSNITYNSRGYISTTTTGSYPYLNDNSSLKISQITVETFIRPTSFNGTWNIIASKWFGGTTSEWHWSLKNNGSYKHNLYTTSTSDIYGTSSFSLNRWYHVAFTITSGGVLSFYTNGLYDGGTTGISFTNGTSPIYISDYRSTIYGMTGDYGPFKIYSRALTSNQILQNYNTLKGRFGL